MLSALISVTTIPAAAAALAFTATTDPADSRRAFRDQALTSLGQLLDTTGIVLAGMLVLVVHNRVWTRVGSARA